MTEAKPAPVLRSGGSLWGPERVAAGISIRQLARAAGINKGLISFFEHGRMVPTGAEYRKVSEALSRLKAERHTGEAAEG